VDQKRPEEVRVPRRYRAARQEEHHALALQDAQAFGDPTVGVAMHRAMARTPVEELRVLEDEHGTAVGLLLARGHRVWWGGRPLPAAQVSGLSVRAEHRSRGAGGELVRHWLGEAHDRGAAIATLFPATVPLYRRAGFAYAGTWTLYETSARHLPSSWPDGFRAVPFAPSDDPTPLQERFARVLPGRSGQVERDAGWWRSFILSQRDSGPPQVYLVDGPAGPDGWAVLTVEEQAGKLGPVAQVAVLDWGAVSADGWRSLLALVAGFSSLDATVVWKGPDPEPLALLLREEDLRQIRQARFMARVLDVTDAFAARGYPEQARGRFTVEVAADETCPWVAGIWTIEADGGEGKAARVDARAAARTDAAGLAALFTGYLDAADLATLGVVTGMTAEDVSFWQAVHAGQRPWSADFY
jgi:predicted acetyltransferase